MNKIKIPNSDRSRALIVVDAQLAFLNARNEYIVPNILKLLEQVSYDVYIEATFHAEKGSLWEKQQKWICPEGLETQTVTMLADILKKFNLVKVRKETKSVFKGDIDVLNLFKKRGVQEVHVVGLDTNDCVLATAYESFDSGFLTYVIEECTESSSSEVLHKQALEILRGQNMTNHSVVEKIYFQNIE